MVEKAKFVVGLGASAGGLEALERFFDHCPVDSGGAFVVVMHLSRSFKSMLDELLARHTKMKVMAAEDGQVLEEDTTYVIQPATLLEVDGGEFRVSTRPSIDPTGPATSIDFLFKSIAQHWGVRGAGIVLSGSGSDGAQGVLAIQEAGGFALAQAPETAKFDSMPLSALATSAVRAVEAPEQLGQTVVEGILYPSLAPPSQVTSEQDDALARILDSVVGASSTSAGKYKHSTFERRVRRRMMDLQINSIAEYAERVELDEIEARRLSQSLLIGVTEFFRDLEAFRVIETQVVPELVRRARVEERPIRVWVPGCATGEEAYSLTMLLMDAVADSSDPAEIQIFATDLKREHVSEAARGEFSKERVMKVPRHLKDRYFTQQSDGETFVVDPDVRKAIVVAPHDILTDPPFTRLDMISCRNLLIYFSLDAQQRIMRNFAFGLLEQGFLFLGPSETVGAQRAAFDIVDARNRVFRRTATKPVRPHLVSQDDKATHAHSTFGRGNNRPHRLREASLQPAYSALLSEYAPPSLLISPERTLLHTFGDVREYTRPPEGVAHLDLAEMVDPALKTPIIAGVERALRDLKPIKFSRVPLQTFPRAGDLVDLYVRPLPAEGGGEPQQLVVTIDPAKAIEPPAGLEIATLMTGDQLERERVQELERELQRTREALQSTIEEIETANEELQSSNEELMSSNEELQSTNEELSSVNEELYSVNSEYHRQNDELARLNADFDLLLQATEIGVIFFDAGLTITRFAGLAAEKFGLSSGDLGRPFSTFRSPFVDGEPLDLIRTAVLRRAPAEAEMQDTYGDAWLLRVVSQPTGNGVVLTMINIERLRAAEADARKKSEMLASLHATSGTFYLELSYDGRRVERELGWFERMGLGVVHLPAGFDRELFDDDGRAHLEAALAGEDDRWELVASLPDARHDLQSRFVRLRAERRELVGQAGDSFIGWQVTGVDIHEQRMQIQRADEQAKLLRGLIEAFPNLLVFIDEARKVGFASSDARLQETELVFSEAVGKPVSEVLMEPVRAEVLEHLDTAFEGAVHQLDLQVCSRDGTEIRHLVTLRPVLGGNGEVIGVALEDLVVETHHRGPKDALLAADRLLARAVRKATGIALLADAETLVVEYANDAGLASLGLRPDRGLPAGVRVSRLTTEMGDHAWRTWLAGIASDGSDVRDDVAVFDVDQRDFPSDVYATMVLDQGRRKAVIRVVINRDRHLALTDLRERSRQLAISNRDLEQFASVVAHDLRAPLRHVRFFANSLKESLQDGLEGHDLEDLEGIDEGVARMGGMIEALIAYARLGQSMPEARVVSVATPIQHALDILGDEVESSGARVTVDVGHHEIQGHEQLLIQLFTNLISNAVKYRRPGSTPTMALAARLRSSSDVEITVSDDGIGVPEEHADRIFELFQRLHSSGEYSGFGIGLAACRRICELHGGSIQLDAEHGNGGAHFVVVLPTANTASNGFSAEATP